MNDGKPCLPPHAEMVAGALLKIQPRKVIEVAALIADHLGDNFDSIPYDKQEWIRTRGGETFRDVNLPFQCDYLRAASAVVKMLEGK